MANNLSTKPVSTTKKGEVKSTGPGLSGGKRRTPARTVPEKGRANFTNVGQMLSAPPMQVSQQGVPYRVLVGDQSADPGYLRPPTQQDIEYGERLSRARQLKESGRLPGGRDPVAVEQRITAAERQTPTWRDEGDSLRESIYGKGPVKGTLSNVGDMLTSGYQNTLGKMVPFAFLPGGAIHGAGWSAQPNQAEGWAENRILAGEGTPYDQSKAWQRKMDLYKHQYYGQSDPGPRPRNVYDDLAMPQPKSRTPMMDVGQGDVPTYLTAAGEGIDIDLGPAKTPPPGSDLGLPAGALATRGLSTAPYLTEKTRNLIKSGFPVENLSPKIQRFIENTMEKPQTFFDLSGGPGGEEEKGEKKETFNILKFLLGLLGLPLKLLGLDVPGEDEKKKKKTSGPRQPQRQRIPWQEQNRMNQRTYTPTHKSGG